MLNLPFNRAESQLTTTGCYSLFGKLPNRADFVRVNSSHTVALEFDGLIQTALEVLGAAAKNYLSEFGSVPIDFQYVSGDQQHVMLGALMPSHDLAGRSYPFIASSILPGGAVDGYLPVSPIAYEVFFDGLSEQVVNAVENSVEALSCRQFLETNPQAYDTAPDDLDLARSVVERFMSMQTARHLSDLLSFGKQRIGLQQALLNIAFYQAFLRRFNSRTTNQLIVLPLPDQKGEQGLMASTWLSLLASLWTATDIAPSWRGSYFIMRGHGQGAQLVTSVGDMPRSFTQAMLCGEIENGMALDLVAENEAWKSHRMYAEAAYALGRVLADPATSLAMLCGFLRDMSRQLERSL